MLFIFNSKYILLILYELIVNYFIYANCKIPTDDLILLHNKSKNNSTITGNNGMFVPSIDSLYLYSQRAVDRKAKPGGK